MDLEKHCLNTSKYQIFAFPCLVAALSFFLTVGVAHGAKVSDLYTADVLVAEQSVTVEPHVARKALEQVLVKITGRRDVLNFPRLKPLLNDPLPLILKYSYEATNTPIKEEQGHQLLAQRLVVVFSQGLLDQRLRELNVRPLGNNRPGVLVWLAEEKGGAREYLGLEDDPVVLKTFRATASSRGLPVFRPLLDIEDETALPVSDSWGFFTDSIRKASARYQPDSILVGRIYSQSGQWKTQWLLLWGGEATQFTGEGKTLRQQMKSTVNHVADKLFADFVKPAVAAGEDGTVIEIAGVSDLADYFQIIRFMEDLPAIDGVLLESLESDQLVLRINMVGTVQQLQRAMGLNQRLVPEQLLDSSENEGQPSLRYRWQG